MIDGLRIVPANEAPWADVEAIFGTRGAASVCWCQRYKLAPREAFSRFPAEERALRLREQVNPRDPGAESTAGVLAYLDGEPVGWCAVQPRTAYPSLLRVYRTPWEGRSEDRADSSVWAVTCVFVRAGFRGRGISYALASGAVEHARSRGARAVEAYPMRTEAGEIAWDEIHVGAESIFRAAGLSAVNRPGKRRVVMRMDL